MTHTNFSPLTLVASKVDTRVQRAMRHVMAFLLEKSIPFFVEAECNHALSLGATHTVELPDVTTGLLVSVGGDGSLLQLVEHACRYDLPVVGVHSGNVGFLSDITLDNLDALSSIVAGKYAFESRSLLGASFQDDQQEILLGPALNEFVISSSTPGRLIRYSLSHQDKVIAHHQSDGIIIATATGSTAYALSAGGPVISPAIACNLLLPVCPHKLSSRPIVYSSNETVSVTLHTPNDHDAVIAYDGHKGRSLLASAKITVHTHQKKLRLVHPPGYDFFGTLQNKLHWEMHHHDPGYHY